ncbi:hypothetical protein GCM10027052_17460 [Parafrigoribacterium mesophilum]|uniref:TetR/AcrR family transcriptional regulator n=1 Tax=Parafrigoribacterium mesophilum TaxID=433646 RepID=UPI0031FD794A
MVTTQPRSAHAREAILAAAAVEFDEHGYAGTSIASIAARAGTVKGHVQYHFRTKSTIATELIQASFARGAFLAPSVEIAPRGIAAIIANTRFVAEQFQSDVPARATVRLLAEKSQIDGALPTPYVGWMGHVEVMLDEAKQDGDIRAGIDSAECAWLMVSAFFGALSVSQTLGALESFPHRVERIVRMLLASLT